MTAQPEPYLFFRDSLEGSLTLSQADYQWLYDQYTAFPCCAEIELTLFSGDGVEAPAGIPDNEVVLFPGYFSLNDVEWNHSSCEAKVSKINTRDVYDTLFRVWETELNVFDTATYPPMPNVSFIATYPDVYSWEIDEQAGDQVRKLPDGNVEGVGDAKQFHGYQRSYELTTFTARLFNLTRNKLPNPAGLGSEVISSFYTANVNPVTLRENHLFVVMGGSDAKRPASQNPQSQLPLTLKEWLDELTALHNVYWLIDDEGNLRLEHYRWFAAQSYSATPPVALDLTTTQPDALKKYDTERYEHPGYGKEELTISLNGGNKVSADWATGNVIYSGTCATSGSDGKTKTNTISTTRVYTDLLAGYLRPDEVPDSAIFVGNVTKGGFLRFMPFYKSVILGLDLLNGEQMAARLFLDYHRDGRAWSQGQVNVMRWNDEKNLFEGVPMQMASTGLFRKQTGIVLPFCLGDGVDLLRPVKTFRVPSAQIEKASVDLDAGTLTLDLAARSRCGGTTVGVDPDDDGKCKPAGTMLSFEIVGCTTRATFADGSCGQFEQVLPYTGFGCV